MKHSPNTETIKKLKKLGLSEKEAIVFLAFSEQKVLQKSVLGFSALYIWEDRVWILLEGKGSYQVLEIVNKGIKESFNLYFQGIWQQSDLVYKSKDYLS